MEVYSEPDSIYPGLFRFEGDAIKETSRSFDVLLPLGPVKFLCQELKDMYGLQAARILLGKESIEEHIDRLFICRVSSAVLLYEYRTGIVMYSHWPIFRQVDAVSP